MAWSYNTSDETLTRGPDITALVLAFTSAALLVITCRIYVRAVLIKALGYDDYVIVIAWLGACGYTATTVVQTFWGLGLLKLEDMPPENLYYFQLSQYIGAPFYVLSIWGFKTSLLLSYLRFIPMPNYRKTIIAIGVIILLAHIGFICGFLFGCTPISKQWDPSITGGHCSQGLPFYLAFSALTIVFDATVIILPLPVLIKSQIPRQRKLILLVLFALGLFVTIIQIIRIHTIKNLSNYLNSSISIIWSTIETDTGIIIASIPTLAPAVKAISSKLRSATSSSNKSSPESSQTTVVPRPSQSDPPARLEMDSWGYPKPAVHQWKSRDDYYDEEMGGFEAASPVSDAGSADRILSPIMRYNGPTIRLVYEPRPYFSGSTETL